MAAGVTDLTIDLDSGEVTATEAQLPAVAVVRPGDDYPTITDIGPLTRFGEMIADYLTDTSSEDEIADYEILAADGLPLDSGAVIGPQWYGETFTVRRREEAS